MKRILIIAFCLLLALVPSVFAMRTDLTLESNAVSIASMRLEFDSYTVPVNSTVDINLWIFDVQKCTCWQAVIYYTKAIVNTVSATQGPFLKNVGSTFFWKQINNNWNATHGRIVLMCTLLGLNVMANGNGILAIVKFKAIGTGSSLLHFNQVMLGNEFIPPKPIPVATFDSNVIVV